MLCESVEDITKLFPHTFKELFLAVLWNSNHMILANPFGVI